jgi:hypothetical protein
LTRSSRIQVSRLAVYWAVLTFALALFWSVALNILQLSGMGPAISLVVPAVLGGALASYFYFFHLHQTLEYDNDGYSLTKGRKEEQRHQWSEFKETSIVRDNYGRNKVRVYKERDGEHFDIDSKACGVDPFALRDYILERFNAKDRGASADVFIGLEREIQRGRAYWIADLNETFRFYQVSGEFFPLIARGSTRPKGFLLSRFVAVTLMPNYEVALYAHEVGESEGAKNHVTRLIRVIETLRDEKTIKWSWLLLFSDGEPPSSIARFIEDFGNKDVGIGCINTMTGRIVTSKNQLGVSLANQMRLNQLIRDLKRHHARSEKNRMG